MRPTSWSESFSAKKKNCIHIFTVQREQKKNGAYFISLQRYWILWTAERLMSTLEFSVWFNALGKIDHIIQKCEFFACVYWNFHCVPGRWASDQSTKKKHFHKFRRSLWMSTRVFVVACDSFAQSNLDFCMVSIHWA